MRKTPYNICKRDLLRYVQAELRQPDGRVTAIRDNNPCLVNGVGRNFVALKYSNPVTHVSIKMAYVCRTGADLVVDDEYELHITDSRFGSRQIIRYEDSISGGPGDGWNSPWSSMIELMLSGKAAEKFRAKRIYPAQLGVCQQIYNLLAQRAHN